MVELTVTWYKGGTFRTYPIMNPAEYSISIARSETTDYGQYLVICKIRNEEYFGVKWGLRPPITKFHTPVEIREILSYQKETREANR